MFRKMLISFFLLAAFSGVAIGASASWFLNNMELDVAVKKAIAEVDSATIFEMFEASSVLPLGFMQCELQALFSRILPLILENPLGESNAVDALLLILKPKVVADTWDSRTSFARQDALRGFLNESYVNDLYDKYSSIQLLESLALHSVTQKNKESFQKVLLACICKIDFMQHCFSNDSRLKAKATEAFNVFFSDVNLGIWSFVLANCESYGLPMKILKALKDEDVLRQYLASSIIALNKGDAAYDQFQNEFCLAVMSMDSSSKRLLTALRDLSRETTDLKIIVFTKDILSLLSWKMPSSGTHDFSLEECKKIISEMYQWFKKTCTSCQHDNNANDNACVSCSQSLEGNPATQPVPPVTPRAPSAPAVPASTPHESSKTKDVVATAQRDASLSRSSALSYWPEVAAGATSAAALAALAAFFVRAALKQLMAQKAVAIAAGLDTEVIDARIKALKKSRFFKIAGAAVLGGFAVGGTTNLVRRRSKK